MRSKIENISAGIAPAVLSGRYTLVIPTYNRPKLLHALVRSLESGPTQFDIIVADSSTDANKKKNREFFKARTEYVSLCADDDLVFADAICRCVAELDRDPESIGCHGIYLNFSISERKPAIDLFLEYSAPSIDAEDLDGRIYQLLARYESLFYAVYRTSCIVAVLQASEKKDSSSYWEYYFWELFSAIAVLAHGKLRRIEQVYLARRSFSSSSPVIWCPTTLVSKDPGKFFSEFAHYMQRLLLYLAQAGIEVDNMFQTRIMQAHLVYFIEATHGGAGIKELIGHQFAIAQVTPSILGLTYRYIRRWTLVDSAVRAIKNIGKRDFFRVGGVDFEVSRSARPFVSVAISSRLREYCQYALSCNV
jgi:hypothetical protein